MELSDGGIITVIITLIALVLFVTEIISIDLVGLLILISLTLFGVITTEEAVIGFSNPATLTVAFMFVISHAILKTGALQYLAHGMSGLFKNNFRFGLLIMMLLIAFISAFVNNTPIVAVFIPVLIQLSADSKISPSKLLIPLSFASILGGSCTIIGTSTNMLVSGIAIQNGLDGISFFDMTSLGIIFAVVGCLYIVFIGINFIPNRIKVNKFGKGSGAKIYQLDLVICNGSNFIGKSLQEINIFNKDKFKISGFHRNNSFYEIIDESFCIQKNDIIRLLCDINDVKRLKEIASSQSTINFKIDDNNLKRINSIILELVVTSDSIMNGKLLEEIDLKGNYRACALAVKHKKEHFYPSLLKSRISAGDILVVEIDNDDLEFMRAQSNKSDSPFVLLSENSIISFDRRKFIIVSTIAILMVLANALKIVDIMVSVLASVILLVLIKVITMKEVYRSINWKVIFLMVGSISLGIAMSKTGLDNFLATFIINTFDAYSPAVVLSVLYILTSLFTEVVSNSATAAIFTPIAVACSHQLGVDPKPMIIAIAFAASASFMTPIGYHTNTMVYAAGQYKFIDFLRVGFILNIGFWILASLLIPMVYPF